MRHSLHSHIVYLEETIRQLKGRRTSSRLTVDEVQDIELQLAMAEGALAHYRRAFELEIKVANPESPNEPAGPEGEGGSDAPGNSTGDQKKGGPSGKKRAGRSGRKVIRMPRTAVHRTEEIRKLGAA